MSLFKLQISHKKSFYVLAGFSILIVLASISLAIYTITNTNKSLGYLDRSHDINLHIENMLESMVDAETAQRGYLLTDQQMFLKAMEQSRKEVISEYNTLYEKLRSDKLQQGSLRDLKMIIDKKIETLGESREYFDREGVVDDTLRGMLIEGKFLMDNIRNKIQKIQLTEQRRLRQIREETFKNSDLSIYIILLTCGLSLFLLISLLMILNREYHTKVLIEKELIGSKSLLQQQVYKLNLSNKELEQFAYVASHDLQEPLRKIISFSEKIGAKLKDYNDDDVSNYLTRLNKSADRMRILINDLLNYSRATRVLDTNEVVKLDAMFKIIIEDLDVAITSKNVKMNLGGLETIKGNNTQLRQLFQNLVSNALKFNRSTLPVVSIWGETYSDADVRANTWGKGFNLKYHKYYCIFINDNGIGFEPEYLNQIFIIFQRLHGRSEYEGTGIGLAICKRIVENHEGFITAESALNKGATFIVGLPKKS